MTNTTRLIGEAILYSSIQFAIGSVEMSSKYSVKNFSKDQESLDNAAEALLDYLKIAFVWTIGVSMLLYCKYGMAGIIAGFVSNFFIMYWIYYSYYLAFDIAVKRSSLKLPNIFVMVKN